MTHSTGRKFISALLALVMVLSLSVTAFAASTTTYVPGKYTVTANLYIDGKDNKILQGVTAYITNTAVPPTSPVKDNATLEVKDDGSMYLTINQLNNVFQLTALENGQGASVVSRQETGSGDSKHITSLTIKLDNDSGKYKFGKSTEHPSIVGKTYTMPMNLSVDFSKVTKGAPVKTGAPASSEEGDTEPAGSDAPAVSQSSETKPEKSTPKTILPEPVQKVVSVVESVVKAVADHIREFFVGTQQPAQGKDLQPGTYRVSANVYINAEVNSILHQNVYLTNPENPMGEGDSNGLPLQPVKDNALLTVNEDGTQDLMVNLVNPVLTVKSIGDPMVVDTQTDNGRITQMTVRLPNTKGSWTLKDSKEYLTLLNSEQNMPLTLDVDYTSAKRVTDSTNVALAPAKTEAVTVPTQNVKTETGAPVRHERKSQGRTHSESPKTYNRKSSAKGNGQVKPGRYTVSANIWFSKETTGLPMNPHITNGNFPPNVPVSNNATLVVDENGRGKVTVPIRVMPKLMSVTSISGLPITSTSRSGNRITGITVDLGKLPAGQNAIRMPCTVSIEMGALAQQMSGMGKNHTWPATFQMNFKGLPSSASGSLTPEMQKEMEQMKEETKNDKKAKTDSQGRKIIRGRGKLSRSSYAAAEKSSNHAGAIAGGSVGGAAVIAAIVTWLVRRKH